MRYIPSSASDRKEMLDAMGIETVDRLFAGIPAELRLQRPLRIPAALSEPELLEYFQAEAARNWPGKVSFAGAGIYRHHIPVVIDALISRSEFFTAYTPYQAEVAQGTLQAIFEFQTYITQLTGMDVANASLYDGSTALGEAVLMAQRVTRRNKVLMAKSVHPEYRAVVETYAKHLGIQLELIPWTASGALDLEALERSLDDSVAAVALQSPNFFGTIESHGDAARIAHNRGALAIVCVSEAISMGILTPPRDADIVVGEGQSFGIPPNFGGPHLGFLGTRDKYLRQMPGRLIGMGKDQAGRRAFVMTLTTREQHIRREKATSNICTNQSLCALMTTIYLATMGPQGLREIAEQNIQKTAYAVSELEKRAPGSIVFSGPRFNEFVFRTPDCIARAQKLGDRGIVAGIPLSRWYPELGGALLISVTEVPKKNEIDALVEGLA